MSCCCARSTSASVQPVVSGGGAAGAPDAVAQASAQAAPQTVAASTTSTPATAPAGLSGPAAALQGKDKVKAIDVSKWQGDIDWPKVAATGVQVAYIKATEGTDYTNANYAKDRAAANANGITIGAYDFAQPGTAGGVEANARAEAEHFLAEAKVQKGDMAPVLDLESANGLSKADISAWASTWADTVKAATGVQPTMYVSPSFADAHLDPAAASKFNLWVAHWDTDNPRVPSGFDGWKVHQYTSDGSVDGIAGRVDMDWVKDPASLVIR
ncbi:MAG: glycoside hydrolase family 25 [Thermoleophilia bacterium]|nr:glycoside hydrolase family 25 [Thermoleophilia bacterium]